MQHDEATKYYKANKDRFQGAERYVLDILIPMMQKDINNMEDL